MIIEKRLVRIRLAAAILAVALTPLCFAWAQEAPGASGGEKTTTANAVDQDASSGASFTGKDTARLEEVVVEAKKPLSAASSEEIRAKDYELRPHETVKEILNNVPGLVVQQHQGGGKATQYLIRGFDADHGTDFAVFVDGMPVNLRSHAHGQGYADLNFVIPETVERLQLYKGPYFAQFGDFATAGALNMVLKDEMEESLVRAEGGSFGTQRYVAAGSPRLGKVKTLIAGEAYFSDGPFISPQSFHKYNALAKLTLEPTAESKLSVWGSVYSGDWDASGQIPLREVLTGQLDRFGSIDNSEGGFSDRENLNLHYTYSPTPQDTIDAQIYGSRYSLKLFSDFTFFQNTGFRFLRQPDGSIEDTGDAPFIPTRRADYVPGDGLEQTDDRVLYGGRLGYTRYWSIGSLPVQSEVAVETRNDQATVGLHRQVRRQRFFTVNQVAVDERSVSGYLQQQIFFTDWARLELGLRGDVFFFDVGNRLPVQGTDPNFEAVNIAGNTTDSMVSPKANLILSPLPSTDIYFNFGTGFHSNDARSTVPNNGVDPQASSGFAPLARAIGYEVGTRTRQFGRLDAAASLWLLDLDSELVFSGDGGRIDAQTDLATGNLVPTGSTRRWGVDFETRYQLTEYLFADYDLSWADPRYRATGEAVPVAPTLLMNGGLTAELRNGFSAALRFRFLDNRPAIEDRSITAEGYTLVDLLAKYRWRNFELSLALLNLTDTAWREAQFADGSCVASEVGRVPGCEIKPGMNPGAPAPDIHFTPGDPFAVRGGLTVYF